MSLSRRRPARLATAVILGALLLAGACSSDSNEADRGSGDLAPEITQDQNTQDAGTSSTASTSDNGGACKLLTAQEIEDATGQAPLSSSYQEGTAGSLETCEWTLPVPEDDPQADLGMSETSLQLVLMPESEYRSRTEGMGDLYTEIDGPGDQARWAFSGNAQMGTMAQLYVLQGDRALLLLPGGTFWTDEAAAKDALTSLAADVLDRW